MLEFNQLGTTLYINLSSTCVHTVNTHTKTALGIHFIHLYNSEIYCIVNTCSKICFISHTISSFHNFIFICCFL